LLPDMWYRMLSEDVEMSKRGTKISVRTNEDEKVLNILRLNID